MKTLIMLQSNCLKLGTFDSHPKALKKFPETIIVLLFCSLTAMDGMAQHKLEVEGSIFSKTSSSGYNLLMTNTDETSFSDLTMYTGGSSLSLREYGGNHTSEAYNGGLFFSKDMFFSSFSSQRLRIQNDGNLVIGAKTPGAGRAILNPFKDYFVGNSQTVTFDDGSTPSGRFILATTDSLGDGSGIHGNGNAITLWSPGDDLDQLNVNAYLVILDEDLMGLNDTNPYNDGATVAYLNTSGVWTVSDRNRKEEIQKLDSGALQKVKNLNAYRYQYKETARELEKKNLQSKVIGLMAQELEKIIPEAVNKTSDGEYFVNYNMVTPLLVEAIKEQQQIIEKMINEQKSVEQENSILWERLNALELSVKGILKK